MKKLRFLLCSISLCILCLLILTSCATELNAPENLKLNEATQTLSWKKVQGAESYTVIIGETQVVTRSNSYPLEKLAPGSYLVKVCANGDDENTKNSEFSEYSYIRAEESGLRYKLTNNNTEYQLVGIGTAEGAVVMESVYRGKPVTSIAPSALSGNTRITSFVIGDNVKTIGKKAFYNSKAMETVVIPEGVVSIGESAFQTCSKLKSVTLPSSLTAIPNLAFGYCRALEGLTLGDKTETIGSKAFIDCESLKSIIIPDSVTTIETAAFSSCKSATTLKLSNSLTAIPDNAFYRCESVTEVIIGDNVESIGKYAFGSCELISEIDIPDSVKTIDSYAFSLTPKLESVSLGDGLEKIGAYAFYNSKVFTDSESDVVYIGNWIVGCKNVKITQQDFAAALKAETVGIADESFAQCTLIESLKLPNCKYIGDYAFWGCELLRGYPDTVFSEELAYIGSDAFVNCLLLDRFYFGTALTEIQPYAFYNCVRLVEVDLPDTITRIGTCAFDKTGMYTAATDLVYADNWVVANKNPYAEAVIASGTVGIADYCFYKNQFLPGVSFPSSLTYIGTGAFYECIFLSLKSFPQGLKSIGDYAFYNCMYANFGDANYVLTLPIGLEYLGRSAFYQAQLCSVIVPGTVKEIGDYAFFGCLILGAPEIMIDENTKVKGAVLLGEGIEHIGTRAFYNCQSLAKIEIPDSVTSLGERVFNKCLSLNDVKIGNGLTELNDYMFYNCVSLEKITMSDSIKRVGKYAFRGCTKLSDVTFGKNVEVIDNFAFLACESLNSVVLPDSVTTIGNYAFRGLTTATSIILSSNVETIGQHAFYGCNIATIYCEDASVQPYWHERFNSGYRPIFFGVTLSSDRTYVESITVTETFVDNNDAVNGITAPRRAGHKFDGWATVVGGEVVYSATEIVNAPAGTTLYAIYSVGEEAPAPTPEETPTPES